MELMENGKEISQYIGYDRDFPLSSWDKMFLFT